MKKLLLTSQYAHFQKRNSTLLTKREFEIYTTKRGVDALKLHEDHNFDLIFSDFQLEDMNGCTLCSLIREKENSHHVPIIITCHNFPGSIERVTQSGANAMLIKPVEPINLMETIGSFLGLQLVRNKRVVLVVAVTAKAGDVEFSCSSHDISNTGILIETEHNLDVGSRLVCKFTLPDFWQIETEGEVSRCIAALGDNYLYGIKFVAMSLSNRKTIDYYINSILKPASFPCPPAGRN